MSARRRWLLFAAAASLLALALGWRTWAPSRASGSGSTRARPAPSRPLASRQPTHVQELARPTAPAPATAKTGIPACDRFVERTMTCAQLPDDAKIAIAEASQAWARLTAAGPRPDLEASCRATASVQGESLAAMGC